MAHRYRFEDVEIDTQAFRLWKAGEPLSIEPKALNLLIFLVENRGRLVDRREILSAVWKDAFVTDHVLNRAIGQLRKVLSEDAKEPRYIETVPTLGYRFIAQVEEVAGLPGLTAQAPVHGSSPPNDSGSAEEASPVAPSTLAESVRSWIVRRFSLIVGVGVLLASAATLVLAVWWMHDRRGVGLAEQPIRSLVVLPLDNLSGDPSQQYLADGMTEELIGNLGRIGSLRVISRVTAMQYRGTHKSLPEIARELQVDEVVTGSVRRSGDQLRIAAQLFEVRGERQLWSGSYSGIFIDVFKLQNEVASAVTEAARVQISPRERGQLDSSRQVNPEAYEAFLKGGYFVVRPESESVEKSLEFFEQAIKLDPTFARAYVGLARSYTHLIDADEIPIGEGSADAEAALAKAIELDPNLGEAYGGRADTEMLYRWDFPAAERDYKRAIELDPSEPFAREGFGNYLTATGRFDEAIEQSRRARDLDPLSVEFGLGYCNVLNAAGRHVEALSQCKAALYLDPANRAALANLGILYLEDQSWSEAEKVLAKSGFWDAASIAGLEETYGAPGKSGAFERSLTTKLYPPVSFDKAAGYARLGRNDLAFHWLEMAYQKRAEFSAMTWLAVDPSFKKLHSDPRFDGFLRRVGLPPRPQPNTAPMQQQAN